MSKEPFLEPILRKLRIRKIIHHIPENCDLCDFGCGTSLLLLNTLKSYIRSGIGLDLKLKPLFDKKIKLIRCNLGESIPLRSNTIDVITSLAVIEHLSNPTNNLKEAYRILRKGGLLILTTPTPISKKILEFMAFKLGILSIGTVGEHKHYFDKKNLKEMLTCAGFEESKIKVKSFQIGFNNLVVVKK